MATRTYFSQDILLYRVNKKYVEWPDALYDILLYIVNKKYVEWPDALYERILSKPSSTSLP